MAKLLFGTAALCLFIGALSPLHAQGGVFLRACNAGKVDIDVVLWQSGKVSNTHIGSADCASIAETTGSMAPASVGFAFSDSKGQWGAARRLDLLPDLGLDVLKESPRNIIVQHANHNVPFQTQLLFQPRVPTCQTYQSHSAVARLPLNATHAQIAAAQAEDANSPPASTVCETFGYVLNVIPHPESREISFSQFCDICDKKAESRLTPEERAAKQRQADAATRMLGAMETAAPNVFGSLMKETDESMREEQRQRQEESAPVQRVNWNDMPQFLSLAFRRDARQAPMSKKIVVQGTVSKVDLYRPGASEHWVNIYFKESPDKAFNICTSSPEILQAAFGPDFSSRMVGKTLEVDGEVTRAYCESGAGIRVTLLRQLHMNGPMSTARVWSRPQATVAAPAPPVEQEPPMDRSMPNYSLTSSMAGSQVLQYCSGIYDPMDPLLTPEQTRIKNTNRREIEAEVKKCTSSFDAKEVANHRRIAMRYCFGNNNYSVPEQGQRIKAYDQCMEQNDVLTAFCTEELRYRAQLNRLSNAADQKCPPPRPNGTEASVILHGGHEDMGHPVVIPAQGPGLPQILLRPLEAGTIQRAGSLVASQTVVPATASSSATPDAANRPPSPQPSSVPTRQAPVDREQQIENRRKLAAKYVACREQAAKEHPQGGLDFVNEYRACVQAK